MGARHMTQAGRRLQARLTDERGITTVETFVSVGIWFLIVFIFLNMFALISNMMLVETSLTRLSQQVAAQGCLSDKTRQDYINRQQGNGGLTLGASSFTLDARSPTTLNKQYVFNRSQVVDGAGNVQGRNAACTSGIANDSSLSTQTIANGNYIWLRVRYTQKVYIGFFTVDTQVEKTSLVISNSLRSDTSVQ